MGDGGRGHRDARATVGAAVADARPDLPLPAFADVDGDAAVSLVAMMDATDRWPAVQAARGWVLDRTAVAGSVVVDVGCGPGTFGAAARAAGAVTVDIDRSTAMLGAQQRRHAAAAVLSDIARLPLGDGVARLVHVERVLQWAAEPDEVIGELRRVTEPGGMVAVTDTDWGTFVVDHPEPAAAARLGSAAHRWVPRPLVARSLPRLLADAGAGAVEVRTDAVPLVTWDPDDPDEVDGPPGLPLRRMAGAAPAAERPAALAAVEAVAGMARRGRFFATLTLVTVVGRW